ncbi:hypothetical protein F4802DRAFT_549229 [Xylaria palmicola]|nr:hypothetical protein F4802DRAFT_549229 [Xylaria palmicola]
MTTADALVFYPQYCFHLSPTINKWCPLRAIDIAGLECRRGFEDIDVFFCLNHPIRWVRIVGVVVAIDDYYGHRVYTIDDSTGHCIECSLAVPKVAGSKANDRGSAQGSAAEPQAPRAAGHIARVSEKNANDAGPATAPPDVDVGMVLDVKGSVKLFRGQRQIKIQKTTQILSTNQEVLFWDKIRHFRSDILSQPWVLKEREVRRCRKLQLLEAAESGEKRSKRTRTRGGGDRGSGIKETHTSGDCSRRKDGVSGASVKHARSQPTKDTGTVRYTTGDRSKYDALGL